MLSNAYFVAKICFDTAENEPGKVFFLLKNAKLANLLILLTRRTTRQRHWSGPRRARATLRFGGSPPGAVI